jgi:transcriptional regulator with XRE-family HTH domain
MNRMNLLYKMDDLLENCKTCEIRGEVKHYNPVKVCNGCETYKDLRVIGDKLGEERKMGKAVKLTMEQYRDYKAKGLTDGQIAEELGCTPTTISNWKKRQDSADRWDRSKVRNKPDTEVETQSETKDIQEDLKAENGRLKRELEVREKAIKDLQDNAKDSVPRSEFLRLHEDHKAKNDEIHSKLTSEMMLNKRVSELYDKEHSLVIQLDAELENVREQLRQAREESVNYGKENEHLWGLLKIKMEG